MLNTKQLRTKKCVLAAAIGFICSPFVSAQELAIEQIIITAPKRASNIQDTSMAVSAFDGSDLENKSLRDLDHLLMTIPGLNGATFGPSQTKLIPRGVNATNRSVVGVYLNNYVLTSQDDQDGAGNNSPIQFVDMQRVEFLNGPQGTLYGASSFGGTLRYIANNPDLDTVNFALDGDFSVMTGGDESTYSSIMLNLPIIDDRLGVRAVGWLDKRGGFIDAARLENGFQNYTRREDNINSSENEGGRVALRWVVNDSTVLDMLYLEQNVVIDGSYRYTRAGTAAWPNYGPGALQLLGMPISPLPGVPALTPQRKHVNTDVLKTPRNDDTRLTGLTLQHDIQSGSFIVAASQYRHDIINRVDSSSISVIFGIPAPTMGTQPHNIETNMLEARFSSNLDGALDYVAGIYYEDNSRDFFSNISVSDGNANAAPFDPFNRDGNSVFGRYRFDDIERWAIFGEVIYALSPKWELVVGGRYIDYDLESIQATTLSFNGLPVQAAGRPIGVTPTGNAIGLITATEQNFAPKASLSYIASDNVRLYGMYSQGKRTPGANNGNQPFVGAIPPTFKSDTLTSYELGVKSRLFEERLVANGALFYTTLEDTQVEPRIALANIPYTTNGSEARIMGAEFSINALLSDEWRLDMTGTWLPVRELTQDQPVQIGGGATAIRGLDGDEIPNTPDLQFYVGLEYGAEVFGNKRFEWLTDVTYRDEINTEYDTNSVFNVSLDQSAIVNTFVSLQLTDAIRVGAYVKNITDDEGMSDAINTFQDWNGVVGVTPRQTGITIQYVH